ncbi:Derlin-2 [Orbilia brochopaga]|nr:Derlin-2 [Drechslerella brochopaga]
MATPADAVTNLLNQTPPVTRFYAGVTFITSLASIVFGVVNPMLLIYHQTFMTRMPPQLWRLFTSFFLTGGGFAILFDSYMIWQYGSDLEAQHFNTSGDFLFYMLFNGIIQLLLNTFVTGGTHFAPVMGVALSYSWGQRNRGRPLKFFFVQIKAQWLPFCIIGIATLQSPGMALILLTGLVSAHAYEFLTVIWPKFGGGSNLLPTPSWLKWSFEGGPGTQGGSVAGHRGFGTAIDPRSQSAPAPRQSQGMFSGGSRATGASTGHSAAAAWRNRGTGHRLGGE